jgi:hypothetical protein
MERPISQKNTSPMAIRQRPLMSLVIANNLLTPSTRAIDLGISHEQQQQQPRIIPKTLRMGPPI